MKLSLATRVEQQQILAPQMILSMDILLLNAVDLEQRIDKEFTENPALELDEPTAEIRDEAPTSESERELQEMIDIVDIYRERYGGEGAAPKRFASATDDKYDAIANTAEHVGSLTDHLRAQIRELELDPVVQSVALDLAGEVDERGYLRSDTDDLAHSLGIHRVLVEQAIAVIQGLEPRGIGARSLKECLALQLGFDDGLEVEIVERYLEDLLENRLPKIAEELEVTLDQVSEVREIIASLDPHPGGSYAFHQTEFAIPEVFVDQVDGDFVVRVEERLLPNLRISSSLTEMLEKDGENPEVREFVRKKLESARWLIHAIDQRRRTVIDIAESIVRHQRSFFDDGPGHLNALTMQTVADEVGVHVSTVSRATNGKYIETPYGVVEMRRFFTGGVERASGGIESRDNVCRLIREIVAEEDAQKPLSDSQLAKALQARGIEIARRTVSKYRERAGVPTARLRRQY